MAPLDFTPIVFKFFCVISVTDFIPFLESFLQNKCSFSKAPQLYQAHGSVFPMNCRDALCLEVLVLLHVVFLFSSINGVRN